MFLPSTYRHEECQPLSLNPKDLVHQSQGRYVVFARQHFKPTARWLPAILKKGSLAKDFFVSCHILKTFHPKYLLFEESSKQPAINLPPRYTKRRRPPRLPR